MITPILNHINSLFERFFHYTQLQSGNYHLSRNVSFELIEKDSFNRHLRVEGWGFLILRFFYNRHKKLKWTELSNYTFYQQHIIKKLNVLSRTVLIFTTTVARTSFQTNPTSGYHHHVLSFFHNHSPQHLFPTIS